MTEHILQAYRIDIETRTNPEGNQRAIAGGWKANSHEIKPGVIYKDANVTVTAFATKHARVMGIGSIRPTAESSSQAIRVPRRRQSRLAVAAMF